MYRELNDFTTEELAALLKENIPFFCECKNIADEIDTQWAISDLFRKCPPGVNVNIGYPGSYISMNGYADNGDYQDAIEWIKGVAEEYGCAGISEEEIDKAAEYMDVLRDYTISVKDKDMEYMDRFVTEAVERAFAAILKHAEEINDQFDDAAYLADCLLSCEWLGDYYEAGGKIYRRRADVCVA